MLYVHMKAVSRNGVFTLDVNIPNTKVAKDLS